MRFTLSLRFPWLVLSILVMVLLFCLSSCIPDDYNDCPSQRDGEISITVGTGGSGTDSGQETQMP